MNTRKKSDPLLFCELAREAWSLSSPWRVRQHGLYFSETAGCPVLLPCPSSWLKARLSPTRRLPSSRKREERSRIAAGRPFAHPRPDLSPVAILSEFLLLQGTTSIFAAPPHQVPPSTTVNHPPPPPTTRRRVNEFPLGCIAPASLMWNPPDAGEAGADVGDDGEEGNAATRRVWVWVHPAAANEALRELRRACGLEGAPWQGTVEVG